MHSGRNRPRASERLKPEWLSNESGNVGYLREAYHGAPYATHFFCAEVWESDEPRAYIPAATLRVRFAKTLRLVEKRERTLYKSTKEEIERVKQSYRDFVALCEQKEKETGEHVLIVGSY